MKGVGMPKTLRRTVSVLIAIAVTTLGVYGIVRVAGAVFPSTATIASASAQVQVCPATGCTATSCHGATGAPPPPSQSGSTGQSGAGGQSSVTPDQGSGNGSTVVYACPRTGCTATTCHGATGSPPPTGQGGSGGQSSVIPEQGGGNGSTVVYVCPRTGCTATSCHGATGAPPPSGGRHRRYGNTSDHH